MSETPRDAHRNLFSHHDLCVGHCKLAFRVSIVSQTGRETPAQECGSFLLAVCSVHERIIDALLVQIMAGCEP